MSAPICEKHGIEHSAGTLCPWCEDELKATPASPVAPGDLEAMLEDAIEGMEDMIGYVPEYFQWKHSHQDYIDRAKANLEKVRRLRASSPAPAVPAPPGVREAVEQLREALAHAIDALESIPTGIFFRYVASKYADWKGIAYLRAALALPTAQDPEERKAP